MRALFKLLNKKFFEIFVPVLPCTINTFLSVIIVEKKVIKTALLLKCLKDGILRFSCLD